ncbi:PepSY domain-containing protein [Microvirga sp. W0021]|uniref:PepSY domain-containing protein n=1 Tax=Hohaiivirga grylli TaxID=3133970 RepID=A0ABV0BI40_9HYPH
MNMKILAIASACILAPSLALAQDTRSPEMPAVSKPDHQNPDAPVKGENSFTESQAKERFEQAGYTNVSGLRLNKDGIWEATAMEGVGQVKLKLDYQGNITFSKK